ncbi:MAG: hypothetical protein H7Y62_05935 [Hyphomicrobium sp.]|nr:hypothetical protein [Hyphomicrobium sp.]
MVDRRACVRRRRLLLREQLSREQPESSALSLVQSSESARLAPSSVGEDRVAPLLPGLGEVHRNGAAVGRTPNTNQQETRDKPG